MISSLNFTVYIINQFAHHPKGILILGKPDVTSRRQSGGCEQKKPPNSRTENGGVRLLKLQPEPRCTLRLIMLIGLPVGIMVCLLRLLTNVPLQGLLSNSPCFLP